MTSHYAGLDLQCVSEGFVDMPDPTWRNLLTRSRILAPPWQPALREKSSPLLLTCEEARVIVPM
jgi:hypothetical protein